MSMRRFSLFFLLIATFLVGLPSHAVKVEIKPVKKQGLKPVNIEFGDLQYQVVQPDEMTHRSYFSPSIFAELDKLAAELQAAMPERQSGDPILALMPGFEYVGVTGA